MQNFVGKTKCIAGYMKVANAVGLGQRSRFLVLTKRSAASGDENGALLGFNDLGRTVTPTFLLIDHFLY